MSKVFYGACKVCADSVSPALRTTYDEAAADVVLHMAQHGEVFGFKVADEPDAEYIL